VTGWGRIDVVDTDVSFDEPGEPKTGPRSVPIPPRLVEILRNWVDERGFAPDELIFRTRTGQRPSGSNWTRAWQRALRQIGHSPLRVYDCRHAAATTWLQAGAPLGEVARRLGHSVETFVSTYVGALVGDESVGELQDRNCDIGRGNGGRVGLITQSQDEGAARGLRQLRVGPHAPSATPPILIAEC
jgi:integrase